MTYLSFPPGSKEHGGAARAIASMLCDLGIVSAWIAWERRSQELLRASVRTAARAALRAVNGVSPVRELGSPRALEVRDKDGKVVDLGCSAREAGDGDGGGAAQAAAAAAASSSPTRATFAPIALASPSSSVSTTSSYGSVRTDDTAADKVCALCFVLSTFRLLIRTRAASRTRFPTSATTPSSSSSCARAVNLSATPRA